MKYLLMGIAFLISVIVARIIIPRILLISYSKKLFDSEEERKVHKGSIPRLGGVSFFPAILFTCCGVLAIYNLLGYYVSTLHDESILTELLLFVCGLVLLFLTGISDDLMGVRYVSKIIVQVFCACLFPLSGLWINDLYGLFGLGLIHPFWGGLLTVSVVVLVTNAINLIDGIDGLASGLSCVSLVVFGFLFLEREMWSCSLIAFSTFGVLIPFFYYNVFGNVERSKKIFMGDTGSLTLGYILSFLAIKYSQNLDGIPKEHGPLVIAFSTLLVPVFDAVRVAIVRIYNGRNPFTPDKTHIHHLFLKMGFTVRQALLMILLLSCMLSGLNIWLIPYVENTVMLLLDTILWIGLNMWWMKRIK
ncbi:MraY family glycosyltransferase [uncultured Bacteroides sp.]|uniref:MraY family glycosyltransferase n=2 Tax=uncultured Bacteroides sp. TaxID=162156 RepID=UPI0025E8F49C|nr:MraY family glycosyltransferase [uncultured Bacteroides sp.]